MPRPFRRAVAAVTPFSPAPAFVLLPIGGVMPGGLDGAPLLAGGGQCVRIVAVEENDDPLVGAAIGRERGALDEEADRGAVAIALGEGQEHRVLGRIRVALRPMRQEALVREGPEVVVEGGEPLVRGRSHQRAPAAFEGLLQQGREDRLQRLPLKVIEQDLGHPS